MGNARCLFICGIKKKEKKKIIPEHEIGRIWKVCINCDQYWAIGLLKGEKVTTNVIFPVHDLYALKMITLTLNLWT